MKQFGILALKNFDSLLAIVISVVAAILSVFGGSQSYLLSAIAGILGLLAYGLIKDRMSRDDLLKQVQQLKSKPSVREILKVRIDYAPITETIISAQDIYFMGPSLISIFSQWAGYLQHTKLNEHGATIHAIILDPNCSAIDSAAMCMTEPSENLLNDINRSMLHVKSMLQNKFGDSVKKGSIELRLMQVNPNYSMVLIDPDKPNGKIFVEFIGYQSRLHTRPHIELNRQYDEEWFEYYLSQYRALWENSSVHLTSQGPISQP
jgi:hypothetical protein